MQVTDKQSVRETEGDGIAWRSGTIEIQLLKGTLRIVGAVDAKLALGQFHRQIADILQMEEANVRQLVSRARKHRADGRRTPVSSGEQQRLLEAFIAAAQKADMAALEALFAEDVVSTSDGGGIVRAARVPVCGRERVAKFIATAAHFWNGVKLAWVEANGQAAVLMSRDGVPVALTTIDASSQGIDQIVWILRPSKLAGISKSGQRLDKPDAPELTLD